MTALIIIGIVIGFIAAYLGTGAALARRDLPRSIEANTRKAGSKWRMNHYPYDKTYKHDEVQRGAVRTEQAQMLWGWPVVAPVRGWRHSLESRIDRYDPAVTRALEADLARLKSQLEELEGGQ